MTKDRLMKKGIKAIMIALSLIMLTSIASLLNYSVVLAAETITITPVTKTDQEFQAELTKAFYSKKTSFTIQYTGNAITFCEATHLKNLVSSAKQKGIDDYLYCSVLSVQYQTTYSSTTADFKFTCTYVSTPEEENYVDAEVTRILGLIITPGMTDKQKIRAVHKYIVDHVTYDEALVKRSAYNALKDGKAVCQGYALLTYKMLNQLGIKTRIVTGTLKGTNHAWNLVYVDGFYYQLDITNDDYNSSEIFYMVTDQKLSSNGFVMDSTDYPDAVTIYDETPPVITIGNYNTAITDQSITVTASTNEGTLNAASHTFTANGSFDFIATDAAGNKTIKTVTITNISKDDITAPVITVGNYITTPTNKDIIVTATTNEGTLNATSHTFTSNGSFDFVAIDAAGNKTTKTVTINNIDKTAPIITIGFYDTAKTNQDITVTASTNEGMLNASVHIFTQNGSFDFVATDEVGNVTIKTITITNIEKIPVDTTPPVITVGSYSTSPTNKDIIVTVTTNEGTLNTVSHAFTANGSFDFVATDAAGNKSTKTVTISNIDKSAPVITIGAYDTAKTDSDITVTASTNEGMLNASSYTFKMNGSFDFVATDAAGNITVKTVTITNIDKAVADNMAPIITVGSYTTTPTNKDIVVSVSANEGTLNATSHTFTENGSFDFIATDAAGNKTTKTVTISNIDKTAPVITIGNYTTYWTNQDIVVTASTNEGTLNAYSYTFTINGSYTFVATDLAGNITTRTVTITNINKTGLIDYNAPVITISNYNTAPTNNNIYVYATTNKGTLNTNYYTFTQNGSFDFIATDAAGNRSIKTVVINNIDRTPPIITIGYYNMAVTDQDIIVTASANEGTMNAYSHTFTANGTFTFIATDYAGNSTSRSVTITNIYKPYSSSQTSTVITEPVIIPTVPSTTSTTTATNSTTTNTTPSNTTENQQFTDSNIKNGKEAIEIAGKEQTPASVIKASEFIYNLPDSPSKDKLIEELDYIISIVYEKDINSAINAIDKAEDARNTASIKSARKVVNKLIDCSVKDDLQQQLRDLTKVVDKKNVTAAVKAIAKVKKKKTKTSIKTAKKAINNIMDTSKKKKYQKQLDKIV